MSHPPYIRAKAIELRRRGMTLDEIAERLALPKTTVFSWIKDIPIPPRPRQATPGQRIGSEKMVAAFKAKRDAAYAQGRREFDDLAREPTFIDFVCMYIGEGYKRSRNTVALANSDPHVILLATFWIRRFTRNKVTFTLQYHADQDLDALRRFWGAHVGVAGEEIRLQRKSNSNQLAGRSWRSRHGVLTVVTYDTCFRARLQGWIECVKDRWLNSIVIGA